MRATSCSHINLLSRVDFVMKGGVVYKQAGRPADRRRRPLIGRNDPYILIKARLIRPIPIT